MRQIAVVVCLAVCVLLPACSSQPKPVKLSGKLLYHDKPFEFDKNGGITLTFIQVDEGKGAKNFAAEINRDDMSFVVKDGLTEGIPAGKYRITVLLMSMQPGALMNEINARFSQQESKLEREITADTSLTLDLAKPDGK